VAEPNDDQLDDPVLVPGPPDTGHPAVDETLLGLAELASAPLAEHHDRLAKAHEVLQETLDRSDDDRSDAAQPD
jgi:hypothetical protein